MFYSSTCQSIMMCHTQQLINHIIVYYVGLILYYVIFDFPRTARPPREPSCAVCPEAITGLPPRNHWFAQILRLVRHLFHIVRV